MRRPRAQGRDAVRHHHRERGTRAQRLLDVGAQTLIVPYIQNADEARRAVAATRYPPTNFAQPYGLRTHTAGAKT